ncbi:hypothetical protein [Clostridium sp. CCUG 7971]|uniref:hypothetical protein n=1 Tax=Clostridium sp. CCUG 7971 TaxID=2811414 RepID=UPI001ABB34A6|nr:hypothetical protein [Clostridium sp. CCUG 7971]MBO3443100.1 hypothetical protein [Clostridium sp. CCUG 7971]
MVESYAVSRATRLLIVFSVVFAALEANVAFLAPIITIVIPYKFMRYKDVSKEKENKKILNNLFLFNLVSFLVAIVITKKMNLMILDLIVNIFISFIWYKMICFFDNKKENLYKNPDIVYNKMNKKIDMLEKLQIQTKELMENAETEKDKMSIQSKLDAIQYKIDETKRQLSIIKKQVELKNDSEK